jgi:dipeptidyl aminopeptidase/acylaminoacyl peptidase
MLAMVLCLALSGCTADPPQQERASTGKSTASSNASPSATVSPSATPSESATPTAEPPHPVSLQALIQKKYDGRGLRRGRVLARASSYTRYTARFKSGKLTISGIMNVPRGKGPFPVLVLLHGYIDPAIYTTGRGLKREQDYLARRGYVVLHVDYRNHAQSSDDPNADMRLRLGYTEDTINAVLAIKSSKLPYLDGERVGLLGRSMGGGVVYNVLAAQPGLVDAAVVFAPVSSNAVDNFNRWTRGNSERRQLARRIIRAYGSPEDNPEFWANASAVNYFDRVTEPIIIHHGTRDESCPIVWSRTTLAALQEQGKDARMYTYRGEQHAFGPQWPTSMRRTVAFFKRNLVS